MALSDPFYCKNIVSAMVLRHSVLIHLFYFRNGHSQTRDSIQKAPSESFFGGGCLNFKV